MTDLRSRTVRRASRILRRPHSDADASRLTRAASASQLTPRVLRLFGPRRYSDRAASKAVREAQNLGRADGEHPGFDLHSEQPRLAHAGYLESDKLLGPAQQVLKHDADRILDREQRRRVN